MIIVMIMKNMVGYVLSDGKNYITLLFLSFFFGFLKAQN